MNTLPRAHMELRLRELKQLFNSMDPSPFHERDLDAAAEEFIVDWARELPAGQEFELSILLATPPDPVQAAGTEEAVRNYFHQQAERKRRALRRMFRLGRYSLAIGILFLAGCLTLSRVLGQMFEGSSLFATLELTLDIIGWVALWRPLEIFLYDWWPLRADRRLCDRLGRMRVRVVPPGS